MNAEQFKNEMLSAKESNEYLSDLTSDSKTSIWGNIFYCISYAMAVLYQLFEKHRSEIDHKIATQKKHQLAWIQKVYLDFQYGFDLKPESDLFENNDATPEQIEESKIIKYCAVNESDTQREVIIKIAGETDDELTPIDADKMEAIYAYTEEIKGAGVPYRIINYLPDLLKLSIRIFRDPLILDVNGMSRLTGAYPVEQALRDFMKELPFDGELRLQDLANKLEKVHGVNLLSVDLAQSAWISATTNSYSDFRTIDVRKIPESGYFKIVDFQNIQYVV